MQHNRVYDIITNENEITWKNIIYELIKTEQMDPWDIDVTLLTQKYLETIKKLQETNFFVSGKMILASAMLVRIKSNKLVEEEISKFDNILFQPETTFDELDDFCDFKERQAENFPPLGIKTPQSRKRRVSVKDLIGALERALEVNKRKIIRKNAMWNFKKPTIPEKKVDMGDLIKKVLNKIKIIFNSKKKVTYSNLLPNKNILSKKDKILTLYPLLHLANQNKIKLNQEQHFGEIDIFLK